MTGDDRKDADHEDHEGELTDTENPVAPDEPEPGTHEGPPPSQDDPVAPGGLIPPSSGEGAP